jgi:hypothetical protein
MQELSIFEQTLKEYGRWLTCPAWAWQALVDRRCQALVKAGFPRRKPCQDRLELHKKYPGLYRQEFDRVKPLFDVAEERRRARVKGLEAKLAELALVTEPLLSEGEIVVHVGSSTDYWSQGYGATKYAEGAAQRVVDAFEAAGIPARIESVDSGQRYDHGMRNHLIKVYARTDMVGAEIIRRRPVDLVERVRLSWKRGVNPRVDLPFLPIGFEEAHGLDFFGGKVHVFGEQKS